MQITEIVLTGLLGCELGRYEIQPDQDGQVDLMAAVAIDPELRLMLTTLSVGDTLRIDERWSER